MINTIGHEKMNFIVVLSVCLDGSKLKSMVIFKRKTNILEKMTDKIIVCYNEKGWMNEKLMCYKLFGDQGPKIFSILNQCLS